MTTDHSRRIDTTLRWVLPLAALLAVGPLAAWIVRAIRAGDGTRTVSLLVNDDPAVAIGAGILAIALALAIGLVAARRLGPQVGMTTAGLAMIWPAWMMGRVELVLRLHPTGGALTRLVIEGVLAGGIILAAYGAMARVTRAKDLPLARDCLGQLRRSVTSNAGLAGSLAGAVAALGVAWLIARHDLRGQAIFAAFAAGIASGLVSRLVGTALDQDAPLASAFVGMALAAVVAPALLFVTPGSGGLLDAAVAGTLPGPARLQPIDWITGALLGVSTGLAWLGELEHANASAKPA